MQSERSLTQKNTYCMNLFILIYRTSKTNLWWKNFNSICLRVEVEMKVGIDWQKVQGKF